MVFQYARFRIGEAVEVSANLSDIPFDKPLRISLVEAVLFDSPPDLTGEICTKWNERESTWYKNGRSRHWSVV